MTQIMVQLIARTMARFVFWGGTMTLIALLAYKQAI